MMLPPYPPGPVPAELAARSIEILVEGARRTGFRTCPDRCGNLSYGLSPGTPPGPLSTKTSLACALGERHETPISLRTRPPDDGRCRRAGRRPVSERGSPP